MGQVNNLAWVSLVVDTSFFKFLFAKLHFVHEERRLKKKSFLTKINEYYKYP